MARFYANIASGTTLWTRKQMSLPAAAILIAYTGFPVLAQESHPPSPLPALVAPTLNTICGPIHSWPTGYSAPIKITDELVLSVPLKYMKYAFLPCQGSNGPSEADHISRVKAINFAFFLPDFSGYTVDRFRERFDVDKVEVIYVSAGSPHEADLGAAGKYPPNQLKRALEYLADPDEYSDMYGLRCYQARILKTTMYCYGAPGNSDHEGILFEVMIPPYAAGLVNPQMRTNYFSRRYGGIEIAWRTNVKNLPQWQEIDRQIWKFLATWDVAKPKKAP